MENNKIKISYCPDKFGKFGQDNINIDIEKTSFGALGMFVKDMKKLAEKWHKQNNKCWHPVRAAYSDLLKKLSENINTELQKDEIKRDERIVCPKCGNNTFVVGKLKMEINPSDEIKIDGISKIVTKSPMQCKKCGWQLPVDIKEFPETETVTLTLFIKKRAKKKKL